MVYQEEVVSRSYRLAEGLGSLPGRMRLDEGCREVKEC